MTQVLRTRKLLSVFAALLMLMGGGSGLARAASSNHTARDSSAKAAAAGPGSCSDGIDNDGDGKLDGADDDCREDGANDEDGKANCSDGVDNDKDGNVDFPADKGCTSANDGSERSENQAPDADDDDDEKPNCSDGVDNDKDGKTDFPADPGCTSAKDGSERSEGEPAPEPAKPRCSDGIDNDKDGKIDFPADKGCKGPNDGSEDSENDETTDDTAQCADGIDNDNDGKVDYSNQNGAADPGCINPDDDTENSDATLIIQKRVEDAQRPTSYNFTFDVDCPGEAHDQSVSIAMTPTAPAAGTVTQTATGQARIEELHNEPDGGAICTITERDPGTGWNTTADGRPGRTTTVQLNGDQPTTAVFVNTRGGGGTTPPPSSAIDYCSSETDPREPLGIAETLYDSLLNQIPIFVDPTRNGPLSGALGSALAPLDPLGVELACVVSLLDGNPNGPPPVD